MEENNVEKIDAFIETAYGTRLKLSELPLGKDIKPFEFFTVTTHLHGRIVCVVKKNIDNRIEAVQVPVVLR